MKKILLCCLAGGLLFSACQMDPIVVTEQATDDLSGGWRITDYVLDITPDADPSIDEASAQLRSSAAAEIGDGTTEYLALVTYRAHRGAEVYFTKTFYLAGFDTVYAYAPIANTGFGIYGAPHTVCSYPTYSCGPDPTTWSGPAGQIPTEVEPSDPYTSMGVIVSYDGVPGGEIYHQDQVSHFRSSVNPDGSYDYEFSLIGDPTLYILENFRKPKFAGRNEVGGEILYQNFNRLEADGAQHKLVIAWQQDYAGL